jgi:hypothetical protein
VLDRPDVAVFPLAEVGHLDLRLPSPGVADNHPDAVSLWDADRGAVRRACFDTVGAIPENHQGRLGLLDVAAGKLADREPRLADAVRGRLDFAWAVYLGLLAWGGLVERWAQPRVAAELYRPDEALSAA